MPSWKQTSYEMVADEIRAMFLRGPSYALACSIADRFQRDNPRFDREKFLALVFRVSPPEEGGSTMS